MINAISDILKQSIADFEIHIKNDNEDSVKIHENLIKTLEKKLKDINARELSQWEAQSNPDPSMRMPHDIFRQLNERLQKEKEEVQEALHEAYETIPQSVNYVEKVQTFRDALNALHDPNKDAKEKNRLLKDCIERIEYNREKPVRIKRDKGVKKGEQFDSPGGRWTNPEIELEVKLKV
jgi:myosin heavy subunit